MANIIREIERNVNKFELELPMFVSNANFELLDRTFAEYFN